MSYPYDDREDWWDDRDEPEEPPTAEEVALMELADRQEADETRGMYDDYPDGIDEWSAH